MSEYNKNESNSLKLNMINRYTKVLKIVVCEYLNRCVVGRESEGLFTRQEAELIDKVCADFAFVTDAELARARGHMQHGVCVEWNRYIAPDENSLSEIKHSENEIEAVVMKMKGIINEIYDLKNRVLSSAESRGLLVRKGLYHRTEDGIVELVYWNGIPFHRIVGELPLDDFLLKNFSRGKKIYEYMSFENVLRYMCDLEEWIVSGR